MKAEDINAYVRDNEPNPVPSCVRDEPFDIQMELPIIPGYSEEYRRLLHASKGERT